MMLKVLPVVSVMAVATAFYTDVDEKLNLVKILNDPVQMHSYIDCALDKGPCTDTEMSYKKHFNDAIDNSCAQCSPHQKHIVEEFIKVMVLKYPKDLEAIRKKYDPEGTHFKRILQELAKY